MIIYFADPLLVYTKKDDCLAFVKKFPGSRFKYFSSKKAAVDFSQSVQESPNRENLISNEKPSPYRGLKYKDLIIFKKAIEKGNIDFVKEVI